MELSQVPLKLGFLMAKAGRGFRGWECRTLSAFLGTKGEVGKLVFLTCLSSRGRE